MKELGFGILSWNRFERVTNRYGSFALHNENFSQDAHVTVDLNNKNIKSLASKRVSIRAEVVEARESGHIGDIFLGVFPETPAVGELVELGIGTLVFEKVDGVKTFKLKPDDNREELWIDPRKLYRLHDQTVRIFAEEVPNTNEMN